ncbi:MAG: response regulator [Methanoregula sp.]|nr:response regulator [Methanoregula sp.]
MTRIIIADDNPRNLYLMEAILKGSGYEVIPVKNGAEALAAAKRVPPDLIVTDILMPVMDGFELCRQWKADDVLHSVPFIFYTATYTDPKDEKFAVGLGAERFLTKPQKPDILIQEIQNVLDESFSRKTVSPTRPLGDEMEVLRQYNEVLFRKLEKKVLQLEAEIAERKAAQQQRETLIRELEQKNAELARFTYTVSHELRSPLITIQGFAGLIQEEAAQRRDPAELKDHVLRITRAVNTLNALLSDLLRLSQAGKKINTPAPVGFGIIASEAVDIFTQPVAAQGVRFVVDPDFPEVTVDHARIREVVVNLLENAIKYRGDQSDLVIRIGVDRSEKEPVFFVQDNGMGIESRYLERVFNIFEKLDGGSTGTGIGLAIVKSIIEAHGGKVWAESEGPGRGTTFRFTLPAAGTASTDNHNNG